VKKSGAESKNDLAERFGKAAPTLLKAGERVSVRNIERDDVVGADNLHHSRRSVRCAGHKHGNWAIVERVGKEPKLPSIVHAHEDRLEVFIPFCLQPCQAIGVLGVAAGPRLQPLDTLEHSLCDLPRSAAIIFAVQ
jgi:hypothetical protein